MTARLGSFAADVRAAVLAGLSTATNAAIVASDNVLVALGKLQAQLNAAAPLNSPALTGAPTAPNPGLGVVTTQLATAQSAFQVSRGLSYVGVSNANITLTAGQVGTPIIYFYGTLTGNVTVTMPAMTTWWQLENSTSGAFSLTINGPGGNSAGAITIPSGLSALVWSDSSGIYPMLSYISSLVVGGSLTAPTPATADNSTTVPTTAFVKAQGYTTTAQAAAAAPVQSVAGRGGAVTLAVADVSGAVATTDGRFAAPAITGGSINGTTSITTSGAALFSGASTFFQNMGASGTGGTYPNGGLTLGWNMTGGSGECVMLLGQNGGGAGGLNVFAVNNAGKLSPITPILSLSAAGALAVPSSITALQLTAGQSGYTYTISRNSSTGYLEFAGVQTGFIGYSFKGNSGAELFRIDNNGAVTATAPLSAPSLALTTSYPASQALAAPKGAAGPPIFRQLSSGDIFGTNVFVTDYGADPTGAADSAPAIRAAIAAAQSLGVDVFLPAGDYKINSTISIGNGTASTISTLPGVKLIGQGVPIAPVQTGFNMPQSSSKSTRIFWGSTSTTQAMIAVLGPLEGWGFENLHLVGNTTPTFGCVAMYGILVVSGLYGVSKNLCIESCLNGIYSTTVPLFTQGSTAIFTDSYRSKWDNVWIGVGWANGAKGVVLTGGVNGSNVCTSNTDYQTFDNLAMCLPTSLGAGQVAYGIYLQAADSCVFRTVQFFNGGACSVAIEYDYSVNHSWPASCSIENVDWGPNASCPIPLQVGGVPDNTARPNYIYKLSEANDSIIPTYPVNLATVSEVLAKAINLANVASLGNQTLGGLAVTRAGFYRVTYLVAITGGNATAAGSVVMNLQWTDLVGTTSYSTPAMFPGGSADNRRYGSQTIYCAKGSVVTYNVIVSGVTSGATQFAVWVDLERL